MKSLVIFITAILIAQFSHGQSMSLERNSDGAWVLEHGERVLFYQAKTKSIDGEYARADYIHPLYNVDGYELTEDFPKDHLHHRGIFWTWHQVIIVDEQIGDAWECKDFIWDVVDFKVSESTENSLTLRSKTLWKSPQWKGDDGFLKAFVEENAKITVYQKKDNYRIIDFEISLKALEKDLKIGGSNDHKGYGGFSIRMKMPKDITFSSTTGQVEPRTPQIEAGPWMNISGTLASNSKKGGVIIMNHTGNPMYPENWILRRKGSMQNPVYPGQKPVSLSTTDPTVLKHRLVTYTGQLSDEQIQSIISSY